MLHQVYDVKMTKKHGTTILQRDLKEWFSLSVLLLLIGAGFTFAHLAESSRQQMAERERLQVLTALLASNIESDLAATNVALPDVFDALSMRRPYKQAWPITDIVAHLRAGAGSHFEPALTTLFIDLMPRLVEIKERFREVA